VTACRIAAVLAMTALVVVVAHRCPRQPSSVCVCPAQVDVRPVLRELVSASDVVAIDVAEIEARCWMAPSRLTVAHMPPMRGE